MTHDIVIDVRERRDGTVSATAILLSEAPISLHIKRRELPDVVQMLATFLDWTVK